MELGNNKMTSRGILRHTAEKFETASTMGSLATAQTIVPSASLPMAIVRNWALLGGFSSVELPLLILPGAPSLPASLPGKRVSTSAPVPAFSWCEFQGITTYTKQQT